MTDMKYDYPEGLTTCDHLAHDIRQGRFPERSSISQFICERGAREDKVAPETTAKIAALAHRFWSIHPSTIGAMNLSREEFYAREMTRLITSETERLIALNKKLTEDFNTLALDRSQWQERAEKLSIALQAEQAINKDLKIELDEARADIEASISDFKVAGGKLSEAQDALLELRAAFVQAWAEQGWRWGIDTVVPMRDVESEGNGKDRVDCMKQFKAAWEKFAADPARLVEFLAEKRRARRE